MTWFPRTVSLSLWRKIIITLQFFTCNIFSKHFRLFIVIAMNNICIRTHGLHYHNQTYMYSMYVYVDYTRASVLFVCFFFVWPYSILDLFWSLPGQVLFLKELKSPGSLDWSVLVSESSLYIH